MESITQDRAFLEIHSWISRGELYERKFPRNFVLDAFERSHLLDMPVMSSDEMGEKYARILSITNRNDCHDNCLRSMDLGFKEKIGLFDLFFGFVKTSSVFTGAKRIILHSALIVDGDIIMDPTALVSEKSILYYYGIVFEGMDVLHRLSINPDKGVSYHEFLRGFDVLRRGAF